MNQQLQTRAESLFDYLQEIIKLGLKTIRTVDEHQDDFLLFQHELPDSDDISLYTTSEDNLIWLSVHRQNIPEPPKLPKDIQHWVTVFSDPDREPQIIEQQVKDENGNHTVGFCDDESCQDAFSEYLEQWEKWAKEARIKKRIQVFFDKLFKINEQLKYDEQLELIWGHGLLLCKYGEYTIKYPLITQRMVAEHRASEGVIHIFPEDDTKPKLELDPLKDTGLPDLSEVRKQFTDILGAVEETAPNDTLYPLDFCYPLLKEIAGRLTPDGEVIEPLDAHDLIPDSKLRIADCWVLFLRKRQQDAIIRDIERFREKLKKEEIILPDGFSSVLRDPDENPVKWDEQKSFDEWDAILDRQILFPLPANQEQIQILDRIDRSDGVIVWGPPGTGKSHSIANLICHFMAEGKRVLVTSQKDQALAVLHDMVPKDLQPLCMSVLSNVRDNREKLERAVTSITEIVTQSQPTILKKEINEFEDRLDHLREDLVSTQRRIQKLSSAQFRHIAYGEDEQPLPPVDIVEKVKKEEEKHTWLTDIPHYEIKVEKSSEKDIVRIVVDPPLDDAGVEELKSLRKRLFEYFDDLSYELPDTNDLIDESAFRKMAEDLQKIVQLDEAVEKHVPGIIFKNESEECIDQALKFLKQGIDTYKVITEDWQHSLLTILRENIVEAGKIKQAIEDLNIDAEEVDKLQPRDLLQTIALPETTDPEELKAYIEKSLDRLNTGKRIFGFFEFNRRKKHALKSISINGKSPSSINEWEDVLNYVEFLEVVTRLKYRWNSFARSINAPQLPEDKTHKQDAKELLSLIRASNAPIDYETIDLPRIRQILGSLIVDVEGVLDDLSLHDLEEMHEAIRLKKEERNFKDAKILQAELRRNLQEIVSHGQAHPIISELIECLDDIHNPTSINHWEAAYQQINVLESLKPDYQRFNELFDQLAAQAPDWANKWRRQDVPECELYPPHWQRSWWFQALKAYLQDISDGTQKIAELEGKQNKLVNGLTKTKEKLVLSKVKLGLIENMTETHLRALKRWYLAVRKLGKRRGKYAWRKEKLVQQEMRQAKDAVPVWIMPLYKVSETIPSEFSSFDVVIVDEASQCDLRALLALARGKKAIVVGDPEQISPDAAFIPVEEVQRLIKMYLSDIPDGKHFDLETSLYNLAEIVFSGQGVVMLKEHFRCVPEIIRFSNQLCYDNKILPLRNPAPDQRLEPVLESTFIEGGYREGRTDVNKPEARAICERIKQIVCDSRYRDKTIGVISLTGRDQARYILNIIGEYLTPEQQEECKFRVGDSYAFQGDERDVMLLSMVVGADDEKRLTALNYDIKRYRQRFNVAASRARDKLILFHSVELKDLKPDDLRYRLLDYIQNGVVPETIGWELAKEKFESPFEEAVYKWLTKRGYRVTPQVKVGHYRIDLVVEGINSRLGIECDGAKWHPPEKWWEDQVRQRQLERVGWTIYRIWGTDFYQDSDAAMMPVLPKLGELGITPDRSPSASNTQDTGIMTSITM